MNFDKPMCREPSEVKICDRFAKYLRRHPNKAKVDILYNRGRHMRNVVVSFLFALRPDYVRQLIN